MQACRNHNETLMLDVLDELTDSRVRRDWEVHLASCFGCRTEKARMLHLLGQVRASGSPPELSDAEAQRMVGSVQQARGDEVRDIARRDRAIGNPARRGVDLDHRLEPQCAA
jgi:hypothetical protein